MLGHLTQVLVAWGPLGILLLSILDSAGIPVGPLLDFLLIFNGAQRHPIAWWEAGLAVAGSTAGSAVLFYASRRGGQQFVAKSAPAGRAMRFRAWFLRFGLLTVFIPALIPFPMPMKLFVITAGALGTPLVEFLAVVILARTIRYFGEVWLGIALGHESSSYLKTHVWQLTASAVALFAVLYGLMVWRHRATNSVPTR